MIQQKQVNEYDVILLGSGIGSLIAGTLLSRGRLTVLLLKERGYPPSFVREGYRFVPFSNFSEKMIRAAFLKKLCQSLVLQAFPSPGKEKGQSLTDPHSPGPQGPFQVILPEARIDLFSDPAQLHGEWKREFPRELPQIEQFYNEMTNSRGRVERERKSGVPWPFFPLRPPSLLRRIFSSEPLLNLSTFSEEFAAFVMLQLMAWGGLHPDRFPASLVAYLLSADESKEGRSNIDLEALKEDLLAEYLRSGGRIEEIDGVEKVYKGWRKGFALMQGESGKMVRTKSLILNSPLHRIVNLPGKGGKRLSRWTRRIRPRFVLFPVFVAVHEKVIPVGMKDLLISLLDLGKPYEGGNLLLLAMSPKGDETKAPAGRRALTVESLISWEKYDQNWDSTSLDEHRAGVTKHLQRLIPFLENHIEFIDSDSGIELIRHWSYSDLLYETPSTFHWREGVVPTRVLKNLYFTGKENFPYLGFEGEALSGWMVARQILEKHS